MTSFTPLSSFLGGMLIGLSTLLLWLFDGRIAGISGVLGGLLRWDGDRYWRVAFIAGLVLAPLVYRLLHPLPPLIITSSTPLLIVAGLFVGFGTRLGNGCTSGHGVCGIARLSKRSIVATVLFMGFAAATTFLVRHGIGG